MPPAQGYIKTLALLQHTIAILGLTKQGPLFEGATTRLVIGIGIPALEQADVKRAGIGHIEAVAGRTRIQTARVGGGVEAYVLAADDLGKDVVEAVGVQRADGVGGAEPGVEKGVDVVGGRTRGGGGRGWRRRRRDVAVVGHADVGA